MAKNPLTNAGDAGSIPGLGRSPGKGNGNPLQYSCLENSMDRGAWSVTVHEVARESDMTQGLNNNNTKGQLIVILILWTFFALAKQGLLIRFD